MVEAINSQLFLSIQAQIRTQVPEILWVDQDLGQLENYETRPAVQFPCCLIDFINASYKEEGENVQWGEMTIQLRFGFAPFSSANSAAPVDQQELALGYYELENKAYKVIQGWVPTYNGDELGQPLSRVLAATEQRNDAYRVRVNHYTNAFEDNGAMPVRTTVKADMKINQ